MENKKIRLLFFGDAPNCGTGFGNVSKNILKRLHATGNYDISVIAINYFGDPHELPYKLFPAAYNKQGDIYGRQRLLDILRDKKQEFDILFTLQDTFIMATIGEAIKKLRDGFIYEKEIEDEKTKEKTKKKVFQKGRGFKWIYYYPIDSTPEKEWIEKSVKYADVAVPYTQYARKESEKIVKRKYEVIYHGFDKKTFFPMEEKEKTEFKEKFFKENRLDNCYLLVNVNRNQFRKGMLQTLLAFKIFNKIIPNSVLYTHCDLYDHAGYNLMKIAQKLGVSDNWLYPNPDTYKKGIKFPDSFINGLYNIADANISTTLGEGFGLSMLESMATKTVNVFPDNTAISEILADGRGILVKSGNAPNNIMTNGPIDNDQIRPTVDVMDMVNKLVWAYSHPQAVKEIEEKAYDWAMENIDWNTLSKEWDKLIKNTIKWQKK
jgi:glycosyltransferase involved in cell wall biosynthesis